MVKFFRKRVRKWERKEVNENEAAVQSTTTTSLKLRAINMQISYERALRPILALEVSFKSISSLVEHKWRGILEN